VDSRATNALVLRCGVAYFDDLASQDTAVFSQFFGWTKLDDCDNGDPITRAVSRLLSSRPPAAAAAARQGEAGANQGDVLPRNFSASSLQVLGAAGGCDSRRCSDDGKHGVPAGTRHFRVIPTTVRCEV